MGVYCQTNTETDRNKLALPVLIEHAQNTLLRLLKTRLLGGFFIHFNKFFSFLSDECYQSTRFSE